MCRFTHDINITLQKHLIKITDNSFNLQSIGNFFKFYFIWKANRKPQLHLVKITLNQFEKQNYTIGNIFFVPTSNIIHPVIPNPLWCNLNLATKKTFRKKSIKIAEHSHSWCLFASIYICDHSFKFFTKIVLFKVTVGLVWVPLVNNITMAAIYFRLHKSGIETTIDITCQ